MRMRSATLYSNIQHYWLLYLEEWTSKVVGATTTYTSVFKGGNMLQQCKHARKQLVPTGLLGELAGSIKRGVGDNTHRQKRMDGWMDGYPHDFLLER